MSRVKMHRKFFHKKSWGKTLSLSGGAQFDLGDAAVTLTECEGKQKPSKNFFCFALAMERETKRKVQNKHGS